MSKSQIFEKSTTGLPDNDPRVIRVDFSQSDIGASKKNMPTLPKNDLGIVHVTSK
jgi:hypothetical protein